MRIADELDVDAWNLLRQLAAVYTVDTDQAELIRLVEQARTLLALLEKEQPR